MAIAGIGVTHELGFASTVVIRRESGQCSWFPDVGGNRTEIQEPVSEEIFAIRQENGDEWLQSEKGLDMRSQSKLFFDIFPVHLI